jgi:hypothetical protein
MCKIKIAKVSNSTAKKLHLKCTLMHHILFFTIYCYAQQEKKIIQKEVNGSSVPITIKEFVI